MSRQQFTSRNNIGQVLTFQKSGSTASFDPSIGFSSGSKRVSWRIDNGLETTQIAGNSLSYTGFTSDTNIRTVQMRGNSFKNITFFNFQNKNLYGEINLSNLKELKPFLFGGTSITLQNNLNLTGITNPTSTETIWAYDVGVTGLYNLDLTPFSGGLIKNLNVYNCPNLSGITLGQNLSITESFAGFNSNLTGNLDLTPLSGFGGQFQVFNNPLLTGITNPSSSNIFTIYAANNCNLTGNLDLTPLSGFGGQFQVQNNPLLTGITHSPSSQIFTSYYANSCNLTGNLDLTPLSGFGGDFRVFDNSSLTGITHSPSSEIITQYQANSCNLTGNLDLTPLSKLSNELYFFSNSGLTNVYLTANTQNISVFDIFTCNLTGTLDLSPLTKLGGSSSGIGLGVVRTYSNPSLTNIILPNTTQFFKNMFNVENGSAFALQNCNLDYIDFTKLSGATLLSGITQGNPRISLKDNGMSTTDVNHILVDFSGNATYNPTGWSNVNLNISGTNGAPDSSSGGYNGIDARNFLTGSPYNWTITHS